MTPDELRAECWHAIAHKTGRLVLKIRSRSRGERVRLAGRSGPLGRVVGSLEDGTLLVDFHADEILAWLERAG